MAVKRRKRKTSSSSSTTSLTDYSDVVKRIQPVSALESIVSMLIYGRSGTGKTTFASTFPKPILYIDIKEEGQDSISDVEDAEIIQISTFEEYIQLYWYLESGDHPFKTVVTDTVSQLQDLAIDKAKRDENKPPEFTSQRIFGLASGMMKTWLLNYRDLSDKGINTAFIAQPRITDSGDDDVEEQIIPEVGPMLMPSVANILNAAVKVIGQTYITEVNKRVGGKMKSSVEYCMRLGPHPYYLTKIRKPRSKGELPDVIKDPHFDDILKIMKGEYVTKKVSNKKSKK